MKLHRYGFFRELAHGEPNGGSLLTLRDTAQYSMGIREAIASYLEQGHLLIACPGTVADVFRSDDKPVASPHVLTDGQWAWPGDLAYYVRTYNVPVPQVLLNRMEANRWSVPSPIDLSVLEL
jgi:hypothetical protein